MKRQPAESSDEEDHKPAQLLTIATLPRFPLLLVFPVFCARLLVRVNVLRPSGREEPCNIRTGVQHGSNENGVDMFYFFNIATNIVTYFLKIVTQTFNSWGVIALQVGSRACAGPLSSGLS